MTGTSQVIGVVSRSSTLYGPAATLSSLAEEAVRRGFTVNVESVRTLDRRPIAERSAVTLTSGSPAWSSSPRWSRPTTRSTTCPRTSRWSPLRRPDQANRAGDGRPEAGAYAATRHLLERGMPPSGTCPARRLVRRPRPGGGLAARPDRSWRGDPAVMSADWLAASGFRNGQILARMSDVTAVFAANDHPPSASCARCTSVAEGAPGRQRDRLRRCARGRLLHPAADHHPPRLRRGSRRQHRPAASPDHQRPPPRRPPRNTPTLVTRDSVAPPRQ